MKPSRTADVKQPLTAEGTLSAWLLCWRNLRSNYIFKKRSQHALVENQRLVEKKGWMPLGCLDWRLLAGDTAGELT